MKKTIIFLLFSIWTCAFAQQDTLTLYANPGYNKDPLRTNWVQKVAQKDSLWVLNLYDKKNVLREKISFADKKLEVRKGPYAFYENGNVREEGNYSRGYMVGKWNFYYSNKQLFEQLTYVWGKLNGSFKSYWDNGDVKKEGSYVFGKKTGNWKIFYKDKKLALTEDYDENGELLDGVYFDENGKSVANSFILQTPTYNGGMKAFYQLLAKGISYPKKAAENGTEGIVKLEFTVNRNGSIADVVVAKSPDDELTKEALRMFQYAKDWLPAKELGEPITMRFTVPIKFALNR